jgi:hypothetical protein
MNWDGRMFLCHQVRTLFINLPYYTSQNGWTKSMQQGHQERKVYVQNIHDIYAASYVLSNELMHACMVAD